MSDMLAAVITPVRDRAAITTIAAAPIAIHLGRWARGRGLGGSAPMPRRRLRPSVYWINPSAIPIAASAKPAWKPMASWAQPVSSGPTSAPMLMPM